MDRAGRMVGGVTVGAIGAALIAAGISFVGLLISKEAKTSEFRQSWIDALRSEISQFLVNFNSIADAINANYADFDSKLQRIGPLMRDLNEAAFQISLRLNSKERRALRVIRAVKALQKLAENEDDLVPENIRPLESELLEASADLLKSEWRRVKRGEPIFFFSKYIFLATVLILLTAVIYGVAISAPDRVQISSESEAGRSQVRFQEKPIVGSR